METVHYLASYCDKGIVFRETGVFNEPFNPDNENVVKSIGFNDMITFKDGEKYLVSMSCHHLELDDKTPAILVDLEVPAIEHDSTFFEIIANHVIYARKYVSGDYEDMDSDERNSFYEENKEDFTEWVGKAAKDLCMDIYTDEILAEERF